MLHHYLAIHGKQESECHFHADNCVGQNKNKSVVAYFMWRTLVDLNKEITLSFMRVGHTRCMVDACFGLLKQRYRSSECDTVQHLEATVQASAKCNSAQLFDWEWREWDTFLSGKFKPLPGISKIQHFRFSQDSPGIVMTRTSVDSSESPFQLLKKGVDTTSFSTDDLPQILRPEGLSRDRVQYLKKEVQPFIRPEFREAFFSSLK